METNQLTALIIDRCIKIHSTVGPAVLKKFTKILCHELTKMGVQVLRQLMLPIKYDTLYVENAYKLDMMVENRLVIELKSVSPMPSVYQLNTQLSLLNLKNGMLLNFKVNLMKEGIVRVYNNSGREHL